MTRQDARAPRDEPTDVGSSTAETGRWSASRLSWRLGAVVIPLLSWWFLAGDGDEPRLTELPGPPDPMTIEHPDGVTPSAAEIVLGKRLFFDPRVSGTGTFSCATCHDPAKGFGDGLAKGHGAHGDQLPRHTPPLYNVGWGAAFFWDGRAATLEQQAIGPITNPIEMDQTAEGLVRNLSAVPAYVTDFAALYRDGISLTNAARAIAAFERTLIVRDTPYDRFRAGDATALTPEQRRGLRLFTGRARCIACHADERFTDDSFHHVGRDTGDVGRAAVFQGASLTGAFKTPGLRNVALTAPYFHDGGIATLAEVVAYYNRGGDRARGQDPLIRPLHLSADEQSDLVAFLHALTGPLDGQTPAGR